MQNCKLSLPVVHLRRLLGNHGVPCEFGQGGIKLAGGAVVLDGGVVVGLEDQVVVVVVVSGGGGGASDDRVGNGGVGLVGVAEVSIDDVLGLRDDHRTPHDVAVKFI